MTLDDFRPRFAALAGTDLHLGRPEPRDSVRDHWCLDWLERLADLGFFRAPGVVPIVARSSNPVLTVWGIGGNPFLQHQLGILRDVAGASAQMIDALATSP